MSVEKVGWLTNAEARPEGYYINGEKVKGATLTAEECEKWNSPDTVNLPSGKAVTAAEHEKMLQDMQAAGAEESMAATPSPEELMPDSVSEAEALSGGPMPVITLDDMADGVVTIDEMDDVTMEMVTLEDDEEIENMEMLTEAPITMADLQKMSKIELEELGREHGVELDRREKKSSLVEEMKGVLGM